MRHDRARGKTKERRKKLEEKRLNCIMFMAQSSRADFVMDSPAKWLKGSLHSTTLCRLVSTWFWLNFHRYINFLLMFFTVLWYMQSSLESRLACRSIWRKSVHIWRTKWNSLHLLWKRCSEKLNWSHRRAGKLLSLDRKSSDNKLSMEISL